METKNQKNPLEWMKIAKFIIFCMSCIAAVMIFFYSQQDKTTYQISQNYVTKFEMQLMQKEIEILKLEMRDFKLNFNNQIAKMEDANDSILELITDIRLALAERKND
jgi:predicted PurR-regulated permease PerM|tara:strand:+ start:80 stop:400 length:321 start_codon:yes stop_codon:yes gene_type:complete